MFNNNQNIHFMKKTFLFAMSALLLTGIFSSCEKKQSELTLDDMKGVAKVTGTVKYNQGATVQSDGSVIYDMTVPAVGQTVIVSVPNSSYAGDVSGNQTYTGTVNAQGVYEVSVPVGTKSVTATVSVLPFYAVKYVEIAGGVVALDSVLFNQFTEQTLTLEDKSVETADFEVTSKAEAEVEYNQAVTVQGIVNAQAWKRDSELELEDPNLWAGSSAAYSAGLVIEVRMAEPQQQADEPQQQTMILKYTATSNAMTGEYSKVIMLPNNCWDGGRQISVRVRTLPTTGLFTHRYYNIDERQWKAQEIEVLYQEASVSATLTYDNTIVPLEMDDILVKVKPLNREEVLGIGNSADGTSIATNNDFNW